MDQLVFSPKSLGSALKRQRKLNKLTQSEAGAAFKLDQTTVSSIEQGAAGTRLETLFRMLAALNLEMIVRSKKNARTTKKETW